jgi:hypothetical protein
LASRPDGAYKPASKVPVPRIEAHGGYLLRAESLAGLDLQAFARESLEADGVPLAASALLVSFDSERRLVRLAYDGPHTYGPAGAEWYRSHHALARVLSLALPGAVHAYAFDPDRFEAVTAYGSGAVVGGETLLYEEQDLEVEDLSEAAFEAERQRWPMGRLARLVGLSREELLRLPYAQGALLSLQAAIPRPGPG